MDRRVAFLVLALALLAAAAGGGETRELRGRYRSDKGDEGELAAVLTPTRPGAWEVEFRFRFRGELESWAGTATGSLDEGRLEGRAEPEGLPGRYLFRGEWRDGVLEAEHFEIQGESETPTGTLWLGL